MRHRTIVIMVICLSLLAICLHIMSNKNNDNNIIDDNNIVDNYEDKIFNNNYVHTIDIKINNNDWEDLQNNPLDKTKYVVDVEIDGELIKNVSFKTKGNSSLRKVAEGPKTARYSFKINFGKYIKNQTYYGLNKLHLNNIYADATYLKDYISYDMFREIGVSAPLTSFIFVKVNGNNLGLYLAAEEVGSSFFERNEISGNLYKPFGTDNGGNLKYIDNNIDSYSDIFDNEESNVLDEDRLRLINTLYKLNNNEDLEEILDTDEIIKYFVVHNYLLSYDSYTGRNINNYYLLENNGKLAMLPWDYNMIFGAFDMKEDETFIVNYGIDSPLYEARNNERPMWNWILTNEEYLKQYHNEMSILLNDYIDSGKYEKKIMEAYELIKPYLSKEKYTFYNSDDVDKAIEMLKEFMKLRSVSIQKQLNGELATVTKEQNDSDKVDASMIDITKMGLKTGNMGR